MKAIIRLLQRGRTWVIGLPFVWLLLFFALPFAILLRISVTDMGGGENPFVKDRAERNPIDPIDANSHQLPR